MWKSNFIPEVRPCRFASVSEINQILANVDSMAASYRVVCKVVEIGEDTALVADPEASEERLVIRTDLIKKVISIGDIYEFLGELEVNTFTEDKQVKFRPHIMKDATGYHPKVYDGAKAIIATILKERYGQ